MADRSPPQSATLPPLFIERMASMLGAGVDAFLTSLLNPSAGLRVNTLRLTPEDFEIRSPFPIRSIAHPPEGFLLGDAPGAGRHPYHAAGLYYLQDPSAMVVAAALDPQPGERVLDMCAAPGGKATHIAARMGNSGLLVANDLNRKRALELAGNLERCGVRNSVVTADGAERLASHFGAYFDRVLVDAPCSGESMFHKSPSAIADWSLAAIQGAARRQKELLAAAGSLVRPGGLLVYSTCTFAPEENEEVIEDFLGRCSEFEPDAVDLPGTLGTERVWSHIVRLWPHHSPGSGHFVATLRRRGSAPDESPDPRLREGATPAVRKLFERFLSEVYPTADPGENLYVRGDSAFEMPASAPPLRGLNVVRPGVWCGTLMKGRFEPAHALALALDPSKASDRVELPAGDPRTKAFLMGSTIESAGRPGWLPVTVDGFAIGWGKRVGSVVKNHYPKGLRHTERRTVDPD